MQKYWNQIRENQEVRRNLIAVKAAIKETEEREQLRQLFRQEPEVLLSRLQDEDAKIRKNAALILGILGENNCREALLAAYGRETQRFVKSAYLTALQGCDCREDLEFFRSCRKELLSREQTPETEKHMREELEALNGLLAQYEASEKHRFTGMNRSSDVILTTHRAYRQVTAEQIQTGEKILLGAGVKVLQADLAELLEIRTWRELLFCLDAEGDCPKETLAERLAESNLLSLLEELHGAGDSFRFRIECKSRMTLEQRSVFTRKLAARLETFTGGRLTNSTSDYELELRLIENREGGFLPLLKLYTFPDRRFAYRRKSVAASIQPSLAALLMELARPYLREEARVLDPFCGVGTMLLERNYLLHADTLYGVDFYGPAIQGARENAETARVPAHYINRNFFDFSHEYRFHEIVTNLPVKGKNCTAHDLDFLYGKLFGQAEQLLCEGGRMFLYSHDRSFVKKQLREYKSMKLLQEWLINDKEESWFLVVEYRG